VPKNSERCPKLCNLLLLVELLRLQRPDLRPAEPESLISLVGVPRRRPPSRADAGPAVALLKETLANIPVKTRPTNQIDLFMAALEELNRRGGSSQEVIQGPQRSVPRHVPLEVFPSLEQFEGSSRIAPFGLVATQVPGMFRPGGGGSGGGDLPVPTPGLRSSFSRQLAPLVCRLVARQTIPALGRNQLVLAAVIASSLGCGVGISRGT